MINMIDSIAVLFCSEFENTPCDIIKWRGGLFFKILGNLKALAKRFGIAVMVMVTNQVVDIVGSSEGINGLSIGNLSGLYLSGGWVCPQLGYPVRIL